MLGNPTIKDDLAIIIGIPDHSPLYENVGGMVVVEEVRGEYRLVKVLTNSKVYNSYSGEFHRIEAHTSAEIDDVHLQPIRPGKTPEKTKTEEHLTGIV